MAVLLVPEIRVSLDWTNIDVNLTKTDMKNKRIFQLFIFMGIGFATMVSCKYDEVLPFDPDPGVEVFFSQDILPIFDRSCNGAGCHNGSIPPDLRPANAYDDLWLNGYINTGTPEQSELYLWMTNAKGPMPPFGTNATDNATVLQWITQGALNN
jgi:hypothetical protein